MNTPFNAAQRVKDYLTRKMYTANKKAQAESTRRLTQEDIDRVDRPESDYRVRMMIATKE